MRAGQHNIEVTIAESLIWVLLEAAAKEILKLPSIPGREDAHQRDLEEYVDKLHQLQDAIAARPIYRHNI